MAAPFVWWSSLGESLAEERWTVSVLLSLFLLVSKLDVGAMLMGAWIGGPDCAESVAEFVGTLAVFSCSAVD